MDLPLVIYRTEAGRIHALSAHCGHMGTHLGNGVVVGDRVQCPLHHWEFGGDGRCVRTTSGPCAANPVRQASYPVVEKFGGIFVFNDTDGLFPPPSFASADDNELLVRVGRSVEMDCPWQAVAANGFDMQHFQSVHGRALRDTPQVDAIERHALRLRYTSRVTGSTLSDRIMKGLSGDRIEATVTSWGGTIVLVETRLGRTRSFLLLAFVPIAGGTRITPIYAVLPGRCRALGHARLLISSWLFDSFLYRDVSIMRRMRFRPRVTPDEDPVFCRYLDFLNGLSTTRMSAGLQPDSDSPAVAAALFAAAP